MVLSKKETSMYFSYTYAPNLTHQGASMPTTITPPTALKFIQKAKNYVIWVKMQSAHNHQKERAHSAQANTSLSVHYAKNV
jgi:hypothetical protein